MVVVTCHNFSLLSLLCSRFAANRRKSQTRPGYARPLLSLSSTVRASRGLRTSSTSTLSDRRSQSSFSLLRKFPLLSLSTNRFARLREGAMRVPSRRYTCLLRALHQTPRLVHVQVEGTASVARGHPQLLTLWFVPCFLLRTPLPPVNQNFCKKKETQTRLFFCYV